MSFIDKVFSYVNYLKGLRRLLKKYRRTYRNYFDVIFKDVRRKYPFQVILKNGSRITVLTRAGLVSIAEITDYDKVYYDIDSNMWTISNLQFAPQITTLKIRSDIDNGEIVPIFMQNIYGEIPVEGKVVIDIGANVGDSCIYFALKGASNVIGLEPFRKGYEFARENIRENNLSNKISVLLAGCASMTGDLIVDPNYPSTLSSRLVEGSEGIKIPLLTLEQIIEKNKLGSREIVLKMDCEG
ncbi:MAG TPA: FkbM family methyltransferase, partial [Nitrososphaeraceae archaeon]|nr:FkbM family methyltransferase [Nitrososphaeraceae archaeon]